jgi:hypothetical protein
MADVRASGHTRLGSLASEMDCSHRTLIARFRTCMKLPPKMIARLLRFNRAMRSLDRLARTRADEPVAKPSVETKPRERMAPALDRDRAEVDERDQMQRPPISQAESLDSEPALVARKLL